MNIKNSESKYGSVAIILHWLTAVAVCGLFTTGLLWRGHSDLLTSGLLRAHASFGFLATGLILCKIVWLVVDRSPDPPEKLSPFRLAVFKAVHFLTYAVLLIVAMNGIAIWLAEGSGLAFKSAVWKSMMPDLPFVLAHRITSKLLMVLLLMHIGGVLSYQFLKSDVLSRMGISWFQ